MAEDLMSSKGFWGIVIALAVIGMITKQFAPGAGSAIGQMITDQMGVVMSAFFVIFVFTGMWEADRSNEDLFKNTVIPILILALIIPSFFGSDATGIVMWVVLLMFAPFLGRYLRGLTKGIAAKKGSRLQTAREDYLESFGSGGEKPEREYVLGKEPEVAPEIELRLADATVELQEAIDSGDKDRIKKALSRVKGIMASLPRERKPLMELIKKAEKSVSS